MADNLQTLADLLKIIDPANAERNVSDLLNDAPMLRALFADVASNGTLHSYTKEVGAPVVGFRTVNNGRDLSKSADEQVTVELEILSANTLVDKALADANPRGPEWHIAREVNRHLRAAFFAAEKQMIYGQAAGAADGFEGLADALIAGNPMVVDATGQAAGTGSSVFAIRSTGDLNDVVAITGAGGQITMGETGVVPHDDGTGKTFPAYYTPVEGWLGLQVGGAYSVGRIANLTSENGKGLTDDLIADLLSRFPASRMPTHLVMNRRSLKQLQQSRTATNATGAPAPFPTEAFGVPIIVTDAIVDTETLVTGT